ncbi:MAG: universal stress protein [Sphingomonadales bacterium]|nr:universal stress protein [Sphingomonadales bacterium]
MSLVEPKQIQSAVMSFPFNYILLTDFSEGSKVAADWAAHQMAEKGGTMHLLHALLIPSEGHAVLVNLQSKSEKNARDDLQDQKAGLSHLMPGLHVECHLIHAQAPVVVKRLTKSLGDVPLVMGTQSRSGVDAFLLGNASHIMAEYTSVPLILIPSK